MNMKFYVDITGELEIGSVWIREGQKKKIVLKHLYSGHRFVCDNLDDFKVFSNLETAEVLSNKLKERMT